MDYEDAPRRSKCLSVALALSVKMLERSWKWRLAVRDFKCLAV